MNRLQTTSLKGIAIVAVVGIHTLTLFPKEWFFVSFWSWGWIALDQVLRFAVPLFIFLSGYGLSKRYAHKKIVYADYFKNRFLKLIILYLLWSLFYWLNWQVFEWWGHYPLGRNWWQIIFLGQAEYHLYYIPVLLLLYLLFPLLRQIKGKVMFGTTIIALIIQASLFFIAVNNKWSDQLQNILIFSWLGYFLLGVWFGHIKKFKIALDKIFLLTCLSLVGLVFQSKYLIQMYDPHLATRQTNVMVIPYTLSLIILLMQVQLPQKVNKTFHFFGKWSLIIYFSHTFLLRIIHVSKINLSLILSLVLYVLLLRITYLFRKLRLTSVFK